MKFGATSIGLIAATILIHGCAGREPPVPDAAPHLTLAETAVASRLPPDTVIARVGQETITAGDLDAYIAAIPGPERLEYTAAEPIRELVQFLADRKLMAQAALKGGLDQEPAVRAQLEQPAGEGPSREALLAEAWLQRQVAAAPPPSDAEIARYYAEHPMEFRLPARVEVIRIVAATEAAAGRLRLELARQQSLEDLRASEPDHLVNVDQLWLLDTSNKNELTSVALTLKPGEISPVLHVAAGFAVLRAERVDAGRMRPLEDVREGIRAGLQEKNRQQAALRSRERVRRNSPVTVFEDALLSYTRQAQGGG